MFTPVGFASGLASEDFFYSRTFDYNTTANTITGVMVETELGDRLVMAHGFHRGMNVWEDNNNGVSYAGSLTWTSCDEATVVSTGINAGPEQDERADFQDLNGAPGPDAPGESLVRVNWSLAIERQLSATLSGAVNFDYFYQDGSARFGIENAEAYGVSFYVYRELSDRTTAGLRLEAFRDDDAFFSGGCRSGSPAAASLFTNLTLGLNVSLTDCVTWRPEVRWDWQDRDNPMDLPAYDTATSASQFLLAFDVVARF